MQQKTLIEAYEQIFLQDVLKINFDLNNKDPNLVFVQQTYKSIEQQKNHPISLAKNDSLLDSALFERLQMDNTNPLLYLCESKAKLLDVEDKPWYQTPECKALAQQISELINNYTRFALMSPDDLFPNRLVPEREKNEGSSVGKVAQRLLDALENVPGGDFVYQVMPFLEEDFQDQVYHHVIRIVNQELRKFNIYNKKVYFYISVVKIFIENEKLKEIYFNNKDYPWILNSRGPVQVANQAQGEAMELRSAFGQLLRISLLPPIIQTQLDAQLNDQIGVRAQELSQRQTKSSYNARMDSFLQTQRRYQQELTEIFKLLLKKGRNVDFFAETFKFLQASILGNANKLKEGFNYNKNIQNTSSDAYMLNLSDIMLDMSRKIFDRQDGQTYLKIDPEFWVGDPSFRDLGSQPLIHLEKLQPKIYKQEFGNVTNLYFYTIKMVNIGFLQCLKTYKHTLEQVDEIKKAIDMMKDQPVHQMRIQEAKKLLENLDKKANQYEAVIYDPKRIRDVQEMYETFTLLFFKWIKVDIGQIQNGNLQGYQASVFLYHIPEHILDDMFEFYLFYCYHKQDFIEQFVDQRKASSLLNITTLLSTNLKIAQNPYIQAKFIELMFLMSKINKKQSIIRNTLISSDFAKMNLIPGLIKFYVEIEQTGANHSYYSKFSYRLYANEFFEELLTLHPYVEAMLKCRNDPMLGRMKKMIMNDLNYSMDSAWEKLESQIQQDKDAKKLNPQDKLKFDHQRGHSIRQVKSNLQHAISTVSFLRRLTEIFPEEFNQEIYLEQFATMLNHFLEYIVDLKHSLVIKLLKDEKLEQEFKVDNFLIQISKIYVNLMKSKEFIKAVSKDQRCFKLSYFTTLTDRMSKYPTAPQDGLILLTQLLQEVGEEDFDINNLIDIPENYSDPFLGTLMEDPVMLPTSKTIMDRKSIQLCLMDKELDPYNRAPLKLKDLVELPQLKAEIQNWKQEQISLLKSKKSELFKERILKNRKQNMQVEEEPEANSYLFQGRTQQFDEE